MFTLIVTGSQHLGDAEIVWTPLWWMVNKHEYLQIRHAGGPRGVDAYTHDWIALPGQQWNTRATPRLLVVEKVYDTHRLDPSGAVVANQEMCDDGADACFVFPDHRHKSWALDCAARAWAKGIPVFVFNTFSLGRFRQISEAEGEDLARRMLHWGS